MDYITLLNQVKNNEIEIEKACDILKNYSYEDLGYAKVDHARKDRVGYPEVIFAQNKTPSQVSGIVENMIKRDCDVILTTRASKETYESVLKVAPDAIYNELAKTIVVKRKDKEPVNKNYIAVVTAGTSDIPVAEEAAVTIEAFSNNVVRIFDVGVAGIHRLFSKLDLIKGASVIIAVAGMEGALPSVVGGLVNVPVIAVPTSVGYGANFNGLSALLTMLNSCASGISVVNIDNGFGAGYLASMINNNAKEK